MRWGMQKRNVRGIINELFIPALIAFAGLLITRINFDFTTAPSRLVTTDILPQPIRLIINQDLVDQAHSDIKAQQIWDNLPDYENLKFFYAENVGKNMDFA